MKIKKVFLLLFWIILIIFFECVYRLTLFKNIIDSDFIQMLFFCIPISILLFIFSSLFTEKTNKKITLLTVIGLYVLFFAQMVYYQVYDGVFSVYALSNGGQVLQFWSTILSTILSNIYNYICLTVPVLLFLIFNKKLFDYNKLDSKLIILSCSSYLFFIGICFGFINMDKESIYSSYNLYFNTSAPVLSAKKFGLISTMNIDLNRVVFGMQEKKIEIIIDNDNKLENETKEYYNNLDIDFDSLIENEEDDIISMIHSYFKSLSGTKKNEYTGMFEGKNVILFLAESLDPIAIDKDLTPTLYKLANSGFNFTNYYAPKYPASTADGEFRTEWSLISSRGDTLTLYANRNVYSPYLFVNSFSNYDINIYHNYTGDFYKRNQYFKALGYDNFKSCYYGLNIQCGTLREGASDLEMVNASIDEYINSTDPFFAYYITVSGHLTYYKSSNKMVQKNWDMVEDLPYSDYVKGYLSANIELDKALESLITKLSDAGKLNDTVIIITPDHYPYGLSADQINEVSLENRDDPFELYKSDLIIWNSEMTDTITIDKVGSNPDVLPTMLNLFGIDYDSRMIMGQDLLSDSEGLVVLANRSWFTDTVRYNSVTDEIFSTDGSTVDSNYISKMNNLVDNQFIISNLILENNYYEKVFKQDEID